MRVDTTTSFIDDFIDEERERDPSFRAAYDAELKAEEEDRKREDAPIRLNPQIANPTAHRGSPPRG